jgi:magnesium transporter
MVIIDCGIYEQGRRRSGSASIAHAVEACRESGVFTWIGLYEPSEEEFASIQQEFSLHELAVEDAIQAHQRPKLELFDELVFLVLKTARYVDPDEVIELGEILIFVGENFIITVRHGSASSLEGVRASLETEPDVLRHGPGAVLHAILDKVVDDYEPAISGLQQDIEEVEAEVFSPERSNPAERIYKLKREVLEFNRATGPLVDPVDRLARGKLPLVPTEIRAYFRDVNDHLMRVQEQLEGDRDLLTSVLEANLAQVTVQQNQDVRKISAIVAVLAVPTMIAGIYGMNFDHMPELRWTLGYPAVLAVMALICAGLYRYFRRAGWLA